MGLIQLYKDIAGAWQAPGRLGGNPPPPPPPDEHTVTDFADSNSSGFWRPNGVAGAGSTTTVYAVLANTSTHDAEVNALVKGQTNPYRIMKCGSTSSGTPTVGLEVSGIWIQGRPQGMNFGGIDFLYALSPNIHDCQVTAIQGSAAGPPGETFSLHFQRTNNPIVTDVILDGRDSSNNPIAATLNGNSYLVNGGTWTRVQHKYANTGFGTAIFQATGPSAYTWDHCTWDHCRKAFNLEDAQTNSPFIFTACSFSPTLGTGQGEIMQVSSKGFSAHVQISDPVLTNGLAFPLKLRWYPSSPGGTQVASDMKLSIGGVDKTSDPSKLQLVHY